MLRYFFDLSTHSAGDDAEKHMCIHRGKMHRMSTSSGLKLENLRWTGTIGNPASLCIWEPLKVLGNKCNHAK